MVLPGVVGFKLSGKLQNGVTATDLVLTVTQMLRKHGVVGKFVEFYGKFTSSLLFFWGDVHGRCPCVVLTKHVCLGPGMAELSLADRATIANMSPEYGATMGFFPVDHVTLQYLKLTGRSDEIVSSSLFSIESFWACSICARVLNVTLYCNLLKFNLGGNDRRIFALEQDVCRLQ